METRQLFGGAIDVQLPSRFQDVWTDADKDQSLVLDIVEHSAVPDNAAVAFYFQDLAQQNEAVRSRLQSQTPLGPQDVPGVLREAYRAMGTGSQLVSKGRQGAEAANQVQVQLAVVRLKELETDLLITLNTPEHISPLSAAAQHAGDGAKTGNEAAGLFRQIIHTLRINDYSLFVHDTED